MSTENVSRTKAWLIATRPHTLPAAASPVIVGIALAFHDGVFSFLPAFGALIGALLIQIGTNFANDYYDAKKGADTEDREGFTRVTQSGLISPEKVKRAMYFTFGLSLLVGLYLVYVGGVPILIIGIASIISGIAYTGGPYPFGYYGLGDLFVFIFFGVIAVTGTYYVQAAQILGQPLIITTPDGTVTTASFVASLSAGALTTAILVVNNIRDIETDREAGKRTLAVMIGYTASRVEYTALLVLAYLVPVWFWLQPRFNIVVLLPVLSLPYAALVARTVWKEKSGEPLNKALEQTGKLLTLYSVLFGIGMIA